jgi:hypothetical protein
MWRGLTRVSRSGKKDILAALGTTVRLHPHGDHLEAEIAGKVGKLLLLAASKSRGGFNSTAFRWLGEEEFSVGSIAV